MLTAPAATADSVCEHCGAGLNRAPCGCWVDRDSITWCEGLGHLRHQPADGAQPERCGATP